MNSLLKIAHLCLATYAISGCSEEATPNIAAHLEEPFEIQEYKLGMNERAVLEHEKISCQNPPGKIDADRICSASISVSGQPALIYFYFYNDSLRKLSLSILPRHGQLSELSKIFFGTLESKYGKPSTDTNLAVTWSHKGEAIIINRGDERTMTVNLVSDKYENEKARRVKMASGKVEI